MEGSKVNGTCFSPLLPARASEQGTLLLLLLTGTIFSYFCMSSITSILILAILIAIVLF